eukprot:CAMPEP_0181368228 /NCGR_PEP_ID=MMETSP1106-20121128/11948_1 /TAXON_ID=81844 /ORGANISM="Mantoniella antarctica, Strain SL-175" /LENGTH=321 /DNA_ID=CAMNT_0023484275 /DNA_START=146 /DNA_END=1111 /DNA_ORIENTATION=-
MSFTAVSSSTAAFGRVRVPAQSQARAARAGNTPAAPRAAASQQPQQPGVPRGLGGVSLASAGRAAAFYSAAAALGASLNNGAARSARDVTVAAFSAAADGDGAAADPWKALGVKAGADAEEIKKALDRKKLLYKTEPGKLAKFEEAYDTIVQASLQARLRGDLSGVDKNILNADKVSLFGPYWPIKCTSPMRDIKVNVAISLFAAFVCWKSPEGLRNLQPAIYGMIFQIFRMFMKLVDVDPGPSALIDRKAATKHNNKRFFRSFYLVLGCFSLTLAASYWLPNVICELTKMTIPLKYLAAQEIYVTAIISFNLALLTSYYR